MKIKWDETERQTTLAERGLDFADVPRFHWKTSVIFTDVQSDDGERRRVALGFLGETFVVIALAIVSTAYGDELRVMSLRRANGRERKIYDKATNR